MSTLSIFNPDRDDQLTRAAQHVEPTPGQLRRHARLLRPQARTVDDYALIAFLDREARRIEQLKSGAIEIEHRGDHLWRFTSRRVDDDEFYKRLHNPRHLEERTVYVATREPRGETEREREIARKVGDTQLSQAERQARAEFLEKNRATERALAKQFDESMSGYRENAAGNKRRRIDGHEPRYVDVQGTEGSPTLIDALCAPGTRIELSGITYDSARVRNNRAQEAFYRAPKRVAGAVDHVRVQRAGKVIWAIFEPPDQWDTEFVRAKRTRPNASLRNAG